MHKNLNIIIINLVHGSIAADVLLPVPLPSHMFLPSNSNFVAGMTIRVDFWYSFGRNKTLREIMQETKRTAGMGGWR